MHLIVLLSFFIFANSSNRISVFDRLQFFEKKLHEKCLTQVPTQSKSISELKALVCGENFDQLQTTKNYVATGLIHLFVVSGTHLILIKMILDFLFAWLLFFLSDRFRRLLVLLFLFFYAAVCEFNPPVMRAFFMVALSSGFLFERLYWPSHFKLLLAGLLCLSFEPVWISSLSLQLSWLIALGMSLNQILFKEKPALLKQSLLALWIYPTLLIFQTPNPFFILTNFCLTWFLELILFPLSLLVTVIHFLTPAFDLTIELLNFMLLKTEIDILPNTFEKTPRLVFANWILVLVLHLSCHLLSVHREKKHALAD